MTVAFTNLTTGTDLDGNSSATTASVTLTANRLHLMTVVNWEADNNTAAIPTCTGWTQVETLQFYTSVPIYARVTVLRRMPGSNETGTHTIDFGGVNQTEVRWIIDQSDADVETGGTNGSAAIVQTATNTAASATSITATLGAFSSANNGTYGAFGGYGFANTWTQGTGFTLLVSGASGGGNDVLACTEFRDSNDTTVDVTIDSAVQLGAIAIEIAAAGGGGGPASYYLGEDLYL
jgi:hypothetical protein